MAPGKRFHPRTRLKTSEFAGRHLLIIIALLGIPVGFLLKWATEEEMKDGRKWFRMIAVASLTILLGLLITGELTGVYAAVLSFIFFISAVPLLKKK